LLCEIPPTGDNAAVGRPWLTDESDVKPDEHAVASPFLQFLPVNGPTRGGERHALNTAALNTVGNASINVGMKAEIVCVNEEMNVMAWSGHPIGHQ